MAKNFCGLSGELCDYKNAKIAILPIPFDATSSWGKGADKGPDAMIEASANMELYDIETGSVVCEKGIYTDKPVSAKTPEEMVKKGYERAAEIIKDGKFLVTLGGEHSVSLGPIKVHAEKRPGMSILHLDAHSDRRDSYEGSKYSHACIMARAGEVVKNIVSVGVRSMDSTEMECLDKSKVFFAHEIQDSEGWMREALSKLGKEVYVTIDLDVFDSGIMPSTGTPEPGGLGWYQVAKLLRMVAEKRNIVGFDVVELAPNSQNRAPDFLAAKLVYTLLSYKFAGK